LRYGRGNVVPRPGASNGPEPPVATSPTDTLQNFAITVDDRGRLAGRSGSGLVVDACCVDVD
jgi:hypothetical protein